MLSKLEIMGQSLRDETHSIAAKATTKINEIRKLPAYHIKRSSTLEAINSAVDASLEEMGGKEIKTLTSDEKRKLINFMDFVETEPDPSIKYLRESNWDIQMALDAYLRQHPDHPSEANECDYLNLSKRSGFGSHSSQKPQAAQEMLEAKVNDFTSNDELREQNKDLLTSRKRIKIQLKSKEAQLQQALEEIKVELKRQKKETQQKEIKIQKLMNEEKKQDNQEKCKVKFKEWLCNKVKMKQYLSLFEQNESDDIRLIEFFDEDTIKNDIGIKHKLHRKLILRKTNEFTASQHEFNALLDSNHRWKQYKQAFEEEGVLTIIDFKNDIKSKQELGVILDAENEHQVNSLWNMIHEQNNEGHTMYH